MAKAILLLSGGLDSTLAGKLLLEMGIEVEAVNFVSPFCRCTPRSLGCSAARRSASQLDIEVRVFPCGEDYLETLKHPRFGRGRGMNPCVDCRIYMFSRASGYMAARGADFVATGEVLGERPMSQRRQAMEIIERESGLAGLILRPLCARLMPPTVPEREGIVDRDVLLAISGRSRKPQIELAAKLGVTDYPCPAGGCLLTDHEFAARFRDLLAYEPDCRMADARLLRFGRHFRLPSGAKVVVGRDETENDYIEHAARAGDTLLIPLDVPGPSALCRRARDTADVMTAAGLVVAYIKDATCVDVEVVASDDSRVLEAVPPVCGETVAQLWVGTPQQKKLLRRELSCP